MADLLKSYNSLPSSLISNENINSTVTSAACVFDGCSSYNPYCPFDTSPCPADISCPKDTGCSSDGGCSSDCSDAPKRRSSISVTNITHNGATVKITKNDASTIHVVVREDDGSQTTIWDTGNISITQPTASHALTGLTPSTTYAYNLWDDIGGWVGTMYFKTSPPPFTRFNWTYAGLDSNGSLIYGSEKLSGLGIYVAAWEWNDLADLVEDVTGKSVTRVSSGTTISARIVNTMASALGVSTVSTGDPITANFF